MGKRKKLQLFLGWVLLFETLTSSAWADLSREQVEPKHVFVQAQRIQNEIAQIRNEMGKAKPPFLDIFVTKAEPREVFFQAITLYQKADRLCFDHTRDTGPIPPKVNRENIIPGDVLEVLKQAMTRVNCLSRHWEIPKSLRQPIVNPFTVSGDVFRKILEINRDLNFLLDIPYSPTTVYRRVQETIKHLETLLLRNYPDVDLPELPEFVQEKQPRDVYFQIQKNLTILQQISRFRGIAVLEFYYGHL
ncbi:MAG: hypothetical protein HOF21_13855 [Nitrospina sp.]|nr:hypothetical protein [Nitrospina sp.]MBT5632996.1 hypothetical protein [Nitrospina sp.]